MNDLIKVLLVAMLPISEIRGGLPLALYLGFDPVEAYIIALIGNIMPIPVLLVLLDFLISLATKVGFVKRVYGKILERVERKKGIVERYGYLGLMLFVSVPLPITGAWTGVLIASLLQLDRIKSFFSITVGVCIAGVIVLLASLGIISIAGFIK
ncbi:MULTISPECIES: COG2426 family protein [unclassified Archaeoglobus]|uniref:COG2426 family protein n=1 Tax=unclassified Archaeoglobus TaxID=2643606 RepID=UPI0025C1FE22|nr:MULTISPECIES: small multi-drug export protein [unclassified Archaeoglobus]